MNNEPLSVKLVVVGDGSVGKTCILLSYTTDKFPQDYVPTVFENYNSQISVDSKLVNLSLWDTAGQETYSNLRTLSYGQADIFLIVFSVIDYDSFQNAMNKWLVELSQDDLKKVPKIFVGNKTDMRKQGEMAHVQKETAAKVFADQHCKYFECSAKTQTGLKEIFDEAVRTLVNQKKQEQMEKAKQNYQAQQSTAHSEQQKFCCLIM